MKKPGCISLGLERDHVFWTLVGVVLLASFRFYSSRYYPVLNSDDALNVLMTRDYSLPHDLYCWGQDRGGTLIPFLGQFFYGVLHLSPIWSVSLSNYLLVILGGIGFARLFKQRTSKLMFAIAWLLPPWQFVDMLRFPYGVQYCLVGIALLVVPGLTVERDMPFRPRDHLRMFLFMLITVLMVWVSDLSILTVVAAVITWLVWRHGTNAPLLPPKQLLRWGCVGLIAGAVFISYAKTHATAVTGQYTHFNSVVEMYSSFTRFAGTIQDLLLFKAKEPFMSVYAVLALISSSVVARAWRKRPRNDPRTGLAFFLALDALLLVVAVLASKWASLNGLNRRYFIGAYITVSILVLLLNELTERSKGERSALITVLLWATLLTGACSGPLQMKFIWPRTLEPRVDLASEFLTLGKVGIIGEYGNAYIACTPDPDRIASTPHDKGDVKNPALIPAVFDGRDIYVIKDMWLDSFPDTLPQFGHILVRKGQPFSIAGCVVNQYVEVH